MRDALSIMDRLMAAGEKKLTVELLETLLGLPNRYLITSLVQAMADGDVNAALGKTNELIANAVSPEQVLSTLADRFRDLMVLGACGPETELVEVSGDARKEAVEQSRRFDPAGLVHMIAVCESVQRMIKASAAPRAILDAAIVRMAMTEKFADATAVVAGAGGNGSLAGAGAGSKKR